jgi:CRISPR-associated protein Cas2
MGADDKRWRLVAYDIREPARWRKVYKIVRGAGEPLQYSLFRCRLDNQDVERLRWELAKVLGPEDSLLIVDLCPTCASNVVARNHVEGWETQPTTFRIIGSANSHGHARGGELTETDGKEDEPDRGVDGSVETE